MRVAGRDEARVGRAQYELVQIAILALDAQATAIVVNGNDRAMLGTTAEVLDARGRSNARKWSCGAQHLDPRHNTNVTPGHRVRPS